MNVFLKTLPLAGLLALNFSSEASPSAKQEQDNKTIDVKCYVELLGGGELITFWNISSEKLPTLSTSIVGRMVLTTQTKHKVEIYKSHECILLDDKFTSSNAKNLDAITAR